MSKVSPIEPAVLEALNDARQAVQAFADMVAIMQRWQALPIPAILDAAEHNCPIILAKLDALLAEQVSA